MIKHRSRANVPGESEENSEQPFSNHNARNAGAVIQIERYSMIA
jgi:hypothetical protein